MIWTKADFGLGTKSTKMVDSVKIGPHRRLNQRLTGQQHQPITTQMGRSVFLWQKLGYAKFWKTKSPSLTQKSEWGTFTDSDPVSLHMWGSSVKHKRKWQWNEFYKLPNSFLKVTAALQRMIKKFRFKVTVPFSYLHTNTQTHTHPNKHIDQVMASFTSQEAHIKKMLKSPRSQSSNDVTVCLFRDSKSSKGGVRSF